jgi:hypothetical protein
MRPAVAACRRAAACALAGALTLAPAAYGASARARAEAAGRGARYLESRQGSNGAVGSISSADGVAEAITSLVAGGGGEAGVRRALALVEANGVERAEARAAYAGRIVMGLVAAGRDPRRFGGYDYAARLASFFDPVTGAYDRGIYSDALAVLGVIAATGSIPARAADYLRANQCVDGGFGHEEACAFGADLDTTALVVCALTGAGESGPALRKAREYLVSARNIDGGFGHHPGEVTNANSTGLVLSALAALREDPGTAPWRSGDTDPVGALLRLQSSSGGFRFVASGGTDDYATVQGIVGMAGRAYPVRPLARAALLPGARRDARPAPIVAAPLARSSPAAIGSGTARPDASPGGFGPPAAVLAGELPPAAASRTLLIGVAAACVAGAGSLLGGRVRGARSPR